MRTAEEFNNYYKDNKLVKKHFKKWYKKNYNFLIEQLKADEEIKVIFDANLGKTTSKPNGTLFGCLFALTNKRFIRVRKGWFIKEIQTIKLDFINDINFTKSFGSKICIDTMKETIQIVVLSKELYTIYNLLLEYLNK